jgi:hypothetical protein
VTRFGKLPVLVLLLALAALTRGHLRRAPQPAQLHRRPDLFHRAEIPAIRHSPPTPRPVSARPSSAFRRRGGWAPSWRCPPSSTAFVAVPRTETYLAAGIGAIGLVVVLATLAALLGLVGGIAAEATGLLDPYLTPPEGPSRAISTARASCTTPPMPPGHSVSCSPSGRCAGRGGSTWRGGRPHERRVDRDLPPRGGPLRLRFPRPHERVALFPGLFGRDVLASGGSRHDAHGHGEGRRLSFAVVHTESDFLREVMAGDTVYMRTHVEGIGTKSATFRHRLFSADDDGRWSSRRCSRRSVST